MSEQNAVPPLWFHQIEAIKRAQNLPYYALHFQPGTGKTRTALEIIKHRFNSNKRIMRTIIFTPPIVIQNFREEWFLYTKIENKEVIALVGSGAQRAKLFKQHAFNEKGGRQGKVFVTNYQSLLMPELYKELIIWSPEISVHDEAHTVKNPSSKIAKALDELVNKHSRPSLRLNLTGTAVLNTPLDLFQQIKILAGGFPTLDSLVTGKYITNFFTFRTLFFEDRNARWKGSESYFPKWEAKPSTNELFGRLLSSISMSVEKEACLDLPPEINVTIPVPLSSEQRRDYTTFEKDLVLSKDGKSFTADIALTKGLRLMQIASGFISGLDAPSDQESQPIRYEYKDTERERALKYLLEEICIESDKKCLVWANWHHNYEAIKKVCIELKIKFVECHGLISPKGKEEARKQFIENPDIKVWIANPKSGGVGLNLIVAHFAIWYSRNFSLEAYEQARARSHRGGQINKVTNYHLIAQGTIEPEIVEALQNKQDIAQLIMAKTNIYKAK